MYSHLQSIALVAASMRSVIGLELIQTFVAVLCCAVLCALRADAGAAHRAPGARHRLSGQNYLDDENAQLAGC